MNSNFSLLLLNDKYLDKHPRTWICINGGKIKEIISKIEKVIIKNKRTNREQISRLLSRYLNCNYVSIKKVIRGTRPFYPIPIILELCKLTDKEEYYKGVVEKNIKYLKVNSASAKPIKAPKELSSTLAKIMGAFCADGSLSVQFVVSSKNKKSLEKVNILNNMKIKQSLVRKEHYVALQINRNNYKLIKRFSKDNKKFQTQTHYVVELTDEHKSNVEAFNNWIYEEFGIKPVAYYDQENSYRTIFSNKILARYLIKFFGFLPGYKADIVKEPKIIQDSPIGIRKEFAKGAIMFDGCVLKSKIIHFTSISPYFANSIKAILMRDHIKVGISKNKRGEYTVYTMSGNKVESLLEYLEKGTKKWELLMWLDNEDFTSEQITYEKDLKNTNKILEVVKDVKLCDANFLMKTLKVSHTNIRQHLLILKLKGLINLSNHPKKLNDCVSEGTTVFLKENFHSRIFNKILERFRNYEEFANFLEIHKATLSTWKLKKSRISLKMLKEICLTLEIPYYNALENIYETDREVAEII